MHVSPSYLEDEARVWSLARLWPHRWHESNALLNMLCYLGLHRWMQMDLGAHCTGREVRFCFWCEAIRIDGVLHRD